MLAVAIGLLLTLVLALGVLGLVALPYLRAGSPILTPDVERVVGRAKEQARHKPVAAAGSTWHGLIALREWISRVWAPVSAALHQAMDQLEGGGNAPAATPDPAAAEPSVEYQSRAEAYRATDFTPKPEPVGGTASVGRPRPIPVDSGPIPKLTPSPARPAAARTGAAAPDGSRVIDLRDDSDLNHEAGIARHSR